MRLLLAVSSLVFVAACSSSVATPTGSTGSDTGPTTTSAGSGAGGGTGAGGSQGSTTVGAGAGTPFDAGAPVTTYTTGFLASTHPIILQSGDEQTNCIVVHLGNKDGGYVRRVTADLSQGSHHMIVYKSMDTTEQPTPMSCFGLQGILSGEHPFFIAQQAHAQLDWPDDDQGNPVGFEIGPNQMVRIEFHTINTTQDALTITGKALIDTIPLDTPNVVPSDLAFWGTHNINIPAHGTFDTTAANQGQNLYQDAIPGTKSFAITTHQHHLGTQMQVWYASSQQDTSNRVANGTNWSDPPLNLLNPPLDFPTDGSKMLTYECTWNNPTATQVHFGESFNDEMCFLWHYYYPSQGFQSCLDHLCLFTQ